MKSGDIFFLSASVPYREAWIHGAQPAEIEEAIVSLARAVFARNGRLLFGGHPSVSPLVASVAAEYFPPDPSRVVRPVITFQSKYFEGKLPDKTWELAHMGWTTIHWTERRDTKEDSLSVMRQTMITGKGLDAEILQQQHLAAPRCMIAIGGMEGVRDEAVEFWRGWQRPVFALKSGGAAASALLGSPEQWRRDLWRKDECKPADLDTLLDAHQHRALVDLEEQWWAAHPGDLPRALPFQPYAAIMQWLMDDPKVNAVEQVESAPS